MSPWLIPSSPLYWSISLKISYATGIGGRQGVGLVKRKERRGNVEEKEQTEPIRVITVHEAL